MNVAVPSVPFSASTRCTEYIAVHFSFLRRQLDLCWALSCLLSLFLGSLGSQLTQRSIGTLVVECGGAIRKLFLLHPALRFRLLENSRDQALIEHEAGLCAFANWDSVVDWI